MEPEIQSTNTEPIKGHSFATEQEKSFFHKHSIVSLISKKTEKIATALYMVTDFLPDSEPLKRELRTHALALITGTRKIAARSAEGHYALADETVRGMEDTVVLVTLASTIGLISNMNAGILITEIGKAKADILRHYSVRPSLVATHPGYANVVLTDALFRIAEEEPQQITEVPQTPATAYKGQEFNKGQKQVSGLVNTTVARALKKEVAAKKNDIGLKIARRNDVLNVIRSKGKVSIKDITTIMKDMGEKTVQRELLALVKEGVLAKEGEKRWSTYRIAS